MKRFPKFAIVATAAMLGIITTPGWSQSGTAEQDEIRWTVSPPQRPGAQPDMRIRHNGGHSSFTLEAGKSDLVATSATLGSRTAGAVTFSIEREPGLLACHGMLVRAHEGGGKCRFAPDAAFLASLRAHGLGPTRPADLLTMALVDVDLALIEGLKQQGLIPRTINDIIAAAALKVTPDYVRSLKTAGLSLNSLDDAIACRALGVDEAYVRGIIAAGYQPSASELIAMKATGATPEYAKKMNAAARD